MAEIVYLPILRRNGNFDFRSFSVLSNHASVYSLKRGKYLMMYHFTYKPFDNSEYCKQITVKACNESQARSRAEYIVMEAGFAQRVHTIQASYR